MKKFKLLSIILAVCVLLQLAAPGIAMADAAPFNLTGQTAYLVVHPTTPAIEPGGASALTVTKPDGSALAPVGNTFTNVPDGSTIELGYVFHLNDGDGTGTIYSYSDSNYFTIALPEGITFHTPTPEEADIYAIDAGAPDTPWLMGTWSLTDSHTIRVNFNANVATHTAMWGKISIHGTFDAMEFDDDEDTELTLGTQVYTFTRIIPPPPAIEVEKEGIYNAATNEITWTVNVEPPAVSPVLDGFTLVDVYSPNQDFVNDSFYVGTTNILDGGLDLTTDYQVAYTFPSGTSGNQTITYKTTPNSFGTELGGGGTAEYATFENAATVRRGTTIAAGPAEIEVITDWISKSGSTVSAGDPVVIRWEVNVTIPQGGTVTGATITDTIPAGLALIEGNSTYPIQVTINGGSAETVTEGAGWGTYTYDDAAGADSAKTFRYRFPTVGPVDGQLAASARLVYHTTVTNRDQYLNSNGAVSFTNGAQLKWNEMTDVDHPPKDTSSVGVVGAGGLLRKSAGGTQNYTYPGYIHWTITVNTNKIKIENAKITDTIPAGQQLLIDATHPLTVKKGTTTIFTGTADANLTSVDSFVRDFSYEFPDEDGDSYADTITDTYTVEYDTRIVDTNPASKTDTSGLDTLYVNNSSGVGFRDDVLLTRTGSADVAASGTKTYRSQMIAKSVAETYDYTDHVTKWQIVVNRNRLPLTSAVVTDTIPTGMALLIDATHPFEVYRYGVASPVSTAPTTGANGSDSFTYSFGNIDTQYTVTFYTLMKDETLLTQWTGERVFTNNSSLTATEIATPIGASNTVRIKNPVIEKSRSYTPGTDVIDWSVVINPGMSLLHNASVTDQLDAGLKLDEASLKLYQVAVLANGDVSPASSGTRVTSGFTVDYPDSDNSNTLTVSLPEGSKATYRLEFTTYILTDDINFTNEVTLSGTTQSPDGTARAENIVINNLWSTGGSGSQGLTVYKDDGYGNPVRGSIYRLYNFNKQPIIKGGNTVEATTGSDGKAVFKGLPDWVYYAKEVYAPDGFLLNPDFIGGQRPSSGAVFNTSDPYAVGKISFNKTTMRGVPLSGGEFTLSGDAYDGNEVVLKAASVNGVVTFNNVPLGTYTIRETKAPAGYFLSDTVLTATVVYADAYRLSVTTSVTPDTIKNAPVPWEHFGSISLKKTNDTGKSLSGAEFSLYNSEGTLIKTAVSDKNGLVSFTNVQLGDYTIRETKAPQGYVISDAVISVSIVDDGVTVDGGTFVNKPSETSPKTGDDIFLYAAIAIIAMAGIAAVFVINTKLKRVYRRR